MKRFLVTILFMATARSFANTIIVSSVTELQNAIDHAKPGDVIIVTDGKYTAPSDITINTAGTSKKPIIIEAKNTGAAEITGSNGFVLVSPAAYVTIKGFKFTHTASKAKSSGGTSFCRWTNNIF